MPKFLILLFIVTGLSSQAQIQDSLFISTIHSLISHSIPTLSTSEIKKIRSAHLLDCREKEEFEVSHIKGALYVGYNQFKKKNLPPINLNDTIITYCSIGYRSEKIAEKLKKMGYTNVYNYFGSIFDWVNKGNPVYNLNNHKTDSIHCYSKVWGIWLQKGIKVY